MAWGAQTAAPTCLAQPRTFDEPIEEEEEEAELEAAAAPEPGGRCSWLAGSGARVLPQRGARAAPGAPGSPVVSSKWRRAWTAAVPPPVQAPPIALFVVISTPTPALPLLPSLPPSIYFAPLVFKTSACWRSPLFSGPAPCLLLYVACAWAPAAPSPATLWCPVHPTSQLMSPLCSRFFVAFFTTSGALPRRPLQVFSSWCPRTVVSLRRDACRPLPVRPAVAHLDALPYDSFCLHCCGPLVPQCYSCPRPPNCLRAIYSEHAASLTASRAHPHGRMHVAFRLRLRDFMLAS